VPAGRDAVVRRVQRSSAGIEQTSHGTRPPVVMIESFDGHGFGLVGPHGAGRGGNPSDNSLAVGPNHIFETVNSLSAIYTKSGELFDRTGEVLFGPIGHNIFWSGFGGECERSPNGDTVVRYDQLADRWLILMPRFNRAPVPAGSPPGTQGVYGMCYAISVSPNPLGAYHRYYFERELFPDYPRPAIWPDGYYIPTSTGDNLLPDGRLPEKHACVADRTRMLQGLPATEQCLIVQEANFLNNADIDGKGQPPAGAPNIMIATGGTQLRSIFSDDGIYVWNFHVDWNNPANTRVTGPSKIVVAPYNYLCDGQLTRCVPQRGTDNRLDSQGDKIMQRVVYRNIDGRESLVAVHSVNTDAGAGGVRWYEFRVGANRELVLHQQGTYAPDSDYRWMASPGVDRQGNIGFGYSFGGARHFPGQRFAARLANDTLGVMTFHETVLIEGQGAQGGSNLRWQDYTTTAMDPSDDCTFWYQGDYYKAGATGYTVRIGAFRVPGCLRGTVSGSVYYDSNRSGMREANEPGLPGWEISYSGTRRQQDVSMPPAGSFTTDSSGMFGGWLPADSAYFNPVFSFSARDAGSATWSRTGGGTAYWSGGTVPMVENRYAFTMRDRDAIARLDFGFVCTVPTSGARDAVYWSGADGRTVLAANDPPAGGNQARGGRGARGAGRGRGGRGGPAGWRPLLNNTRYLVNADGSRFQIAANAQLPDAHNQLRSLLRASGTNVSHLLSARLALASLNTSFGGQSGSALVYDGVAAGWTSISAFLGRVSAFVAQNAAVRAAGVGHAVAENYLQILAGLNGNSQLVTPVASDACPAPFQPTPSQR
jgi:hypothetical protein